MFKKASLSPILVEQAGAYSKPLETIEAPLHKHLQLLVPACYLVNVGGSQYVRVVTSPLPTENK